MHKRKLNLELITFLVLTFGFSSIIWFKWISTKEISQLQGLIYVIAIMWSPGLAALITRFIYHRNLNGIICLLFSIIIIKARRLSTPWFASH